MNNAARAGALTPVVGGLCLAPHNARADQGYGADVNCDDPQNQLEMTYCEGEALAREDARLNLAYQGAMERAQNLESDETARLLRQAQRAWITYRDLACASEAATAQGGSISGQLYLGCKTYLTRQRADDLAVFLDVM